jgi:hypothetical protein
MLIKRGSIFLKFRREFSQKTAVWLAADKAFHRVLTTLPRTGSEDYSKGIPGIPAGIPQSRCFPSVPGYGNIPCAIFLPFRLE